MIKISLILNGEAMELAIEDGELLLDLLRDRLDLTGAKSGCRVGECGSCTVLVNGLAVDSCLYLAAWVDGAEVTTIEGLAVDGDLSQVQKAFISEGAVQCGYCTPGMILSAQALLNKLDHPSKEEIKHNLAGNICRCAAYKQIIDAVQKAGDQKR